jgi:hypothetical protein
VAWLAQNAAIAGVAAFANVVNSKATVGRYGAYFFKVSPWLYVLLVVSVMKIALLS